MLSRYGSDAPPTPAVGHAADSHSPSGTLGRVPVPLPMKLRASRIERLAAVILMRRWQAQRRILFPGRAATVASEAAGDNLMVGVALQANVSNYKCWMQL